MLEIFIDKASFDFPVWVCIDGPYLYMHETLRGLNHILNTELEDDKHLVG